MLMALRARLPKRARARITRGQIWTCGHGGRTADGEVGVALVVVGLSADRASERGQHARCDPHARRGHHAWHAPIGTNLEPFLGEMGRPMNDETEDNMNTYTARLEQEDDGRWTVELEEEPRVHTWGKTVDQALTRMKEAAAMWFDTDESAIALVPRPVLPKAAGRTVEQARQARERARVADRSP